MSEFSKSKSKPRTMLNDVQAVGGRLIVKGYRKIGARIGCAFASKMPDDNIIEIYNRVTTVFREAATRRGEQISPLNLNCIVLEFLQVSQTLGDKFSQEHLNYEVKKYLEEGLRVEHRQELKLLEEDNAINTTKLEDASKHAEYSFHGSRQVATKRKPFIDGIMDEIMDNLNSRETSVDILGFFFKAFLYVFATTVVIGVIWLVLSYLLGR